MRRFLAVALAAISCGVAVSALAENISIGTGGTGGVYYRLVAPGRRAVAARAGMQATAEVTGGSIDNLRLISSASRISASR